MAVAADALAMVAGFFLATWIRFDSGWLPVPFGRHPEIYHHYTGGILLVTLAYLLRSIPSMIGTFLVIVFSILTAMGLAGWLGMALTPPSASSPSGRRRSRPSCANRRPGSTTPTATSWC